MTHVVVVDCRPLRRRASAVNLDRRCSREGLALVIKPSSASIPAERLRRNCSQLFPHNGRPDSRPTWENTQSASIVPPRVLM